jgi:hypothetical protein
LFLAQAVEEIGLILGGIASAQQMRAVRPPVDPRVMALAR